MERQLEALGAILALATEALGPGWTVILILGLVAFALSFRVYSHRRVDRGYQAALDEKERTIQRLATEVRQWRILVLTKVMNIGRREAEGLVERNEFATPQEARTALESRRRHESKRRRRRSKR